MDPLSIAASVAGLLSLAGAVVSKGYACVNKAKKNGAEISGVLDEVAGFSGILVALKAQVTDADESSDPLQWFAEDHALLWQNNVKDCEKTLKELSEIILSLTTAKVIKLMIKGDTINANLDKLVGKMERYKSFFILCLQLQAKFASTISNFNILANQMVTVLIFERQAG